MWPSNREPLRAWGMEDEEGFLEETAEEQSLSGRREVMWLTGAPEVNFLVSLPFTPGSCCLGNAG